MSGVRVKMQGNKVVSWRTADGTVVRPTPRLLICDARRVKDDDDPATESLVAFRNGCKIMCRCQHDKTCAPATCDGLYIFDAGGEHISTMHGNWKAEELDNGNIGISRLPKATSDAAQDGAFNLGNALRALNEKNDEFWRSRYEEE